MEGMFLLGGATCGLFLSAFALLRYQRRPDWLDSVATVSILTCMVVGFAGVYQLHPGNTKAMEPFLVSTIESFIALIGGWALHAIIGMMILPILGFDPDSVDEHMRRRRKQP